MILLTYINHLTAIGANGGTEGFLTALGKGVKILGHLKSRAWQTMSVPLPNVVSYLLLYSQ